MTNANVEENKKKAKTPKTGYTEVNNYQKIK